MLDIIKYIFLVKISVASTKEINSKYYEHLQETLEGERMQYVLPDGSMLEVTILMIVKIVNLNVCFCT